MTATAWITPIFMVATQTRPSTPIDVDEEAIPNANQ